MKLRTNETARLLLAIVLAIITGPLVSLARPEKVGKKICSIPNNPTSFSLSDDSFDCNKIALFKNVTLEKDHLLNFRKKIPMCLDQPDDVKVSYDESCSLKYSINASSSDDVIYCYG